MAIKVLERESTWPRSNLVRAFGETIALSAKSCCDQPNNARAALICRGVIMAGTINGHRIIATMR